MAHGTSQYTGPDADWLLLCDYDKTKIIERLEFLNRNFFQMGMVDGSLISLQYWHEGDWHTTILTFDHEGKPTTPHDANTQRFAHWLWRQPA